MKNDLYSVEKEDSLRRIAIFSGLNGGFQFKLSKEPL